ncbi:MAG TPA: DUF502 domain-containing protein [Bryobacteraceae bacterium]
MKKLGKFLASRLAAGALVLAPIYLAVLLLLKIAKTLSGFMRPLVRMLPEWLPAERLLSVLAVLLICFLIGLAIRTRIGLAAWGKIENSVFQKIPGYALFQGLTRSLAGETQNQAWKPALAEIEEALVPAFIIEELADGRFTVFVPSSPTPFAGAIYILAANRVHPLDVPFTHAITVVSRWGSGAQDLVARMAKKSAPPTEPQLRPVLLTLPDCS